MIKSRRKASTRFFSSLFMIICTTCIQAHAMKRLATLNVAPQAAVTANSENIARWKYFAKYVVDGKIPVENQAFADDGLNQTVWSVDPAKDGNQTGWLKFTWEGPVQIRHIAFSRRPRGH